MYALLCFAAFLSTVSALSCPSGYQVIEDRCIRALYLEQVVFLNTSLSDIRDECGKDGAHLPIIKSKEENDMFNDIAKSFDEVSGKEIWIALDLVCNKGTRRLEWIDGTPMDYIPKSSDSIEYDCINLKFTMISAVRRNYWRGIPTSDGSSKTVLCVIDTYMSPTVKPTTSPQPDRVQCGDYSLIENPTDVTKPCFKVFANAMSWENAQKQCAADFGSLVSINNAEENKFFWRTAVSNDIVNGMHIGAHKPSVDSKYWTWIDGEHPIDGHSYSNFISSFPIPGRGECGAMMTGLTNAPWINEDCTNDKLPFICRRPGVLQL